MKRELNAQGDANEKHAMNRLRQKAASFFTEIHATLSRFVCKFTAYILFKVGFM